LEIEDWIEIGTIVAPQGLTGEVRVNPNSDFPERFEQPGPRWLQCGPYSPPQLVELLGGYQIPGKNVYVVKLEGIKDRTEAESLRGYKLLVAKRDRPTLAEDEYHVADLINLQVFNQLNGENIGVVVNIFTAGNDLLEVKLHQQPRPKTESSTELSKLNRISKRKKFKQKQPKAVTVLIPFVKEIVPVVNLDKRIIEINPPSGLLET
jgi:16S rRNA processing protein RimM